jgi:hypothetical protein
MISLVLCLLWVAPGQSQADVRVTIVDARTKAPIPDVHVQLIPVDASAAAPRTAQSDAAGLAHIPGVHPGTYDLLVSTPGYAFERRTIAVTSSGLTLTVALSEGSGAYQEDVTVAAAVASNADPGVSSRHTIGAALMQDLRGIATDDAMRAVQSLPGVVTGDDFQAEFSVRGSAFRHVGLVIDGTPSPLLLHAVRGRDDTGSLAMINADIVERVTLLAGPHPQRHGSWLGATVDFELRGGARDRFRPRGTISGTSASVVLEGPLAGGRGGWVLSGRKSYVDWLIRKLDPDIESTIGFVDAQAKLDLDLTSRQRLELLLLGGEAIYREPEASLTNGLHKAVSTGGLASVRWQWNGDRTSIRQQVATSTSRFDNTGRLAQQLGDGTTTSYAYRLDLTRAVSAQWTAEGGARYESTRLDQTLSRFARSGPQSVRQAASRALDGRRGERSAWAHLAWRGDSSGLTAGARVTDATGHTAWVSPWLMAEHRRGRVTLRAAIGESRQAPPLEVALSSLAPTHAERSRSAEVGIELQGPAGTRLHAAAFSRNDDHLLRPLGEERLDDGVRIGQSLFPIVGAQLSSRTRGAEIMLGRAALPGSTGPTGWVAYTWAHTRADDRVTGETFDGDFDQRHTINAFVQQRLSWRMTVNAKFRAGSNVPLVGYFTGPIDMLRLGDARNRVRLPWYVRLDLRASRGFTVGGRRLTVFVEVVNALGRRNLGQADGFVTSTLDALFFTEKLLPRIPSAGFVIEF